MGLLAATNAVAQTIALKNDRKEPADEDYQAAFAAFCLFPNKPPLAEPYWSKAYAAFGSQSVRDALQRAVGPLAVTLPASIVSGEGNNIVQYEWPTDSKKYAIEVLNLESLSDAK